MNAPLDGVTVLDLTRFLAGPMAGRVLADLGADVIKIEPPVGDPTRHVKPEVDGVSAYYAQTNTGKRNISIDITTSDGADLVARLAEQADVLLENYRPGVLERHGLDASTLRSRAPRLVYCSISGYGQDGPWAGRRAFAPLVHAEAGTLDFAARKRQAGVLPEVQSHGDVYPAMTAAMSILAALVQRDRTGQGQRIDVSMAEVLVYLNEWSAVDVAGFDDEQLFGAWTGLIGELANGQSVAFAGNPVWMFPLWLKAMARPELADDPRFATTDDRLAHQEELRELLRGFVATFHNADALEEHLEPFGIPVGSVRSLRDLATTPWAIEREIFTTVGPGVRVPNRIAQWADADVGARPRIAALGEDNEAVLEDLLGMDAGTTRRLTDQRVLRRSTAP